MQKNLFLQLCEVLHMPHTLSYTNRLFEEHPYKYTLFGLSRLLAEYGIESQGFRFSDKLEALSSLEVPFVAQVSDDLVIVSAIDTSQVVYLWHEETIHLPHEQFAAIWSGVVLLVASSERAGEPELSAHRRAEQVQRMKIWGAALFLILLSLTGLYRQWNQVSLLLLFALLLNAVGLFVGYLLLLRQLRVASTTADRLCNLLKHRTCTDLLDTPASKAAFGISWSEVGTAYFATNLLLLLFCADTLSALLLLSIASLGYVVWSLWYQRFRAHTWCALCLLVQAVLFLQGTLALCVLPSASLPSDTSLVASLAFHFSLFASSTLLLHLSLPVVAQARQAKSSKRVLRSLKLREEIFETLLQREAYTEVTAEDSHLLFGHPDASVRVTVLTNPYCNPCAAMHRRMADLRRTDCCLQFVFTSFGPDHERTSLLLTAAYLQLPPEEAWQLYNDWYAEGKMQGEQFFEQWHLDAGSDAVREEYERHRSWQQRKGFTSTPTILVNGHRLPPTYRMEDFVELMKLEYPQTS